jgi:hypothetical protein
VAPPERQTQAIDLETPRSVAGVIGAALKLSVRHPLVFGVLALTVVVPYELAVLAIAHVAPLGARHESARTALTLALLDLALIGPLVSALYVNAVLTIGRGERPSLVGVASRGAVALPVVVAAQIVAGLGIAAGLFVFIIPGLVLAVRWAVVAQAAAIERTDWMGALRRSLELTRGAGIHVLGVIAVAAATDLGLAALGAAITGTTTRAVDVVPGIAVVTLARAFAALTSAVLYFDLRAREAGR